MVNRSRSQSHDSPSFFICSTMVPPYRSFHRHTRSTNPSRPSSWGSTPLSRSWRFTRTSVPIPAWSVPGSHRTSKPCIRFRRMMASWRV
jgi:hypothetical protein